MVLWLWYELAPGGVRWLRGGVGGDPGVTGLGGGQEVAAGREGEQADGEDGEVNTVLVLCLNVSSFRITS